MLSIVQKMTKNPGSKHGQVSVCFTQSKVMTHRPRATTIREQASTQVVLQYRAGHLHHVSAITQTLAKFQKAMKLTEMRNEGHKKLLQKRQIAKQQKKPRRERRC